MNYIRKLNIKCPKCRTNKSIVAIETVQAFTEFIFENGLCDERTDCANDVGLGVSMTFHCNNCDHRWTGRKGVTIDDYTEVED